MHENLHGQEPQVAKCVNCTARSGLDKTPDRMRLVTDS